MSPERTRKLMVLMEDRRIYTATDLRLHFQGTNSGDVYHWLYALVDSGLAEKVAIDAPQVPHRPGRAATTGYRLLWRRA